MGLVGLFFVGAVLFVNGVFVLGRADPKGTAIMNLLVGGLVGLLTLSMSIITFANPASRAIPADNLQFWATAGTLLFSFTYFMVAGNILAGGDGRAVGWYCVWVSAAAVPTGILNFLWLNDWRFAIIWEMWAVLWFMFFLLLGLQVKFIGKLDFTKLTGYVTLVEAFITCTIPAYLILIDKWAL